LAFNGVTYAGGGGAGRASASLTLPTGGSGGGGNGGTDNDLPQAGGTNTGGGGGCGRSVGGQSGGSGIVVIQYANTFADATATTGSPTFSNTGGFKRYTWTGSGSITF
jgi:hypothetical protein